MAKTNIRLSDFFYVDTSPIHGKGLFAKTNIDKDTFLGTYSGKEAVNNADHVLWVETDDGTWIGRHGQNMLRFLNHCKKPTCEFVGFDLYASRRILAGEEVTINYGSEPV